MFQKGNQFGKKNKGLVRSEETKAKVSKANKGRLVGEKNPLYGVRRFGEDNPAYKGGIHYTKQGYVRILNIKHPLCDHHGYVLRSRLVMEKHLGRFLLPEEVIHHINGIKDDDRIENLKLYSCINEHSRYHTNLRYGNV